jgi:hypothetical protein
VRDFGYVRMNYGYLNWRVYSPQDRKRKRLASRYTLGYSINIIPPARFLSRVRVYSVRTGEVHDNLADLYILNNSEM